MITFGLSKEQFENHYQNSLQQYSAELINYFRKFFSSDMDSGITNITIEIFMGEDGLENPTPWVYLSGKNNRINHNDPSFFPGKSIKIPIEIQSTSLFDENYFLDSNFGGIASATKLTKSWLAECWWKAGGWQFCIPTALSVHDFDAQSRILLTEKSIGK